MGHSTHVLELLLGETTAAGRDELNRQLNNVAFLCSFRLYYMYVTYVYVIFETFLSLAQRTPTFSEVSAATPQKRRDTELGDGGCEA